MRKQRVVKFVSAALLFAVWAVLPADAQSLELCYEDVYDTVVVQTSPLAPPVSIEAVVGQTFEDTCYSVGDNRVNANDLAAAAAIYCQPEGVAVWDIDSLSRGSMAFLVTYDRIDQVQSELTENTMIAEHGGFRLYALTSGELQLNSPPDWEGKEYVFTWSGCERPLE